MRESKQNIIMRCDQPAAVAMVVAAVAMVVVAVVVIVAIVPYQTSSLRMAKNYLFLCTFTEAETDRLALIF